MKQRILFAEDEKWAVNPYFKELEKKGFDCVLAKSGDEAVKKLETEKFDIICLDIMFQTGQAFEKTTKPTEAGASLLDLIRNGRIKNCASDIKIIVLTAVIDDKIENKIRKLGISAYLKKPIEFSEVIKTFCSLR
ncbi:MAG: response regulator transcription factor [Candidatus Hodarchaeota archaeon]